MTPPNWVRGEVYDGLRQAWIADKRHCDSPLLRHLAQYLAEQASGSVVPLEVRYPTLVGTSQPAPIGLPDWALQRRTDIAATRHRPPFSYSDVARRPAHLLDRRTR